MWFRISEQISYSRDLKEISHLITSRCIWVNRHWTAFPLLLTKPSSKQNVCADKMREYNNYFQLPLKDGTAEWIHAKTCTQCAANCHHWSAVVVENSESVMLAQCWDNNIPRTMASELYCRQKLKYLMVSKEVIKAAFKRRTQIM